MDRFDITTNLDSRHPVQKHKVADYLKELFVVLEHEDCERCAADAFADVLAEYRMHTATDHTYASGISWAEVLGEWRKRARWHAFRVLREKRKLADTAGRQDPPLFFQFWHLLSELKEVESLYEALRELRTHEPMAHHVFEAYYYEGLQLTQIVVRMSRPPELVYEDLQSARTLLERCLQRIEAR